MTARPRFAPLVCIQHSELRTCYMPRLLYCSAVADLGGAGGSRPLPRRRWGSRSPVVGRAAAPRPFVKEKREKKKGKVGNREKGSDPLIRNYISCSANALKLTYNNVEFQKCSGEGPGTPAPKAGGGERGEGEGEGEGGGDEREEGRERREGRGGGEGKVKNGPLPWWNPVSAPVAVGYIDRYCDSVGLQMFVSWQTRSNDNKNSKHQSRQTNHVFEAVFSSFFWHWILSLSFFIPLHT